MACAALTNPSEFFFGGMAPRHHFKELVTALSMSLARPTAGVRRRSKCLRKQNLLRAFVSDGCKNWQVVIPMINPWSCSRVLPSRREREQYNLHFQWLRLNPYSANTRLKCCRVSCGGTCIQACYPASAQAFAPILPDPGVKGFSNLPFLFQLHQAPDTEDGIRRLSVCTCTLSVAAYMGATGKHGSGSNGFWQLSCQELLVVSHQGHSYWS